jgi:hypothetical protein
MTGFEGEPEERRFSFIIQWFRATQDAHIARDAVGLTRFPAACIAPMRFFPVT